MYVKLFTTLLDSSVWGAPPETRCVWVAMLLMSDRSGIVRGVESGLARRANVSLTACRAALKYLADPDLETQTQSYGGRRIEPLPDGGGWVILNYTKYRNLIDPDVRREQTLDRVRRHRRQRAVAQGSDTQRAVTHRNAPKPHTEAEAEAEKEQPHLAHPRSASADGAECDSTQTPDEQSPDEASRDPFELAWQRYPKRAGGNSKANAAKAFRARLRGGVASADLLAGVERYAAYVRARGLEHSEYVKQAATFFGAGEHWRETWEVPPPPERVAAPGNGSVPRGSAAEALLDFCVRHSLLRCEARDLWEQRIARVAAEPGGLEVLQQSGFRVQNARELQELLTRARVTELGTRPRPVAIAQLAQTVRTLAELVA